MNHLAPLSNEVSEPIKKDAAGKFKENSIKETCDDCCFGSAPRSENLRKIQENALRRLAESKF